LRDVVREKSRPAGRRPGRRSASTAVAADDTDTRRATGCPSIPGLRSSQNRQQRALRILGMQRRATAQPSPSLRRKAILLPQVRRAARPLPYAAAETDDENPRQLPRGACSTQMQRHASATHSASSTTHATWADVGRSGVGTVEAIVNQIPLTRCRTARTRGDGAHCKEESFTQRQGTSRSTPSRTDTPVAACDGPDAVRTAGGGLADDVRAAEAHGDTTRSPQWKIRSALPTRN